MEHSEFDNNSIDAFKKPNLDNMSIFLKLHPFQPTNDTDLPFVSKKAFFRKDGVKRLWLSFCKSTNKLFCFVCLAFTSQDSVFIKGFDDWKHVYQRINEHEDSRTHSHSSEAFFLKSQNKDIKMLLTVNQNYKRKEYVKKNRLILERIIDVLKLIEKRGLSYRGNRNEGAHSLNNNTLDHGNFLEIMILLSKYDPVINEHFNTIIAKSETKFLAGKKGRGNLLTFLSKNTLQSIITITSSLISNQIGTEVKESKMFSILIDTTQDITVTDQCSIIIRYVLHDGVYEKLIAVKPCLDTSGKGMSELLLNTLQKLEINVENCIGNSTDGAANMQGQYKGMTAFLTKSSPNQVHVWCHSHILNLVLCDATRNPLLVASLFVLLSKCAQFFKESYLRMDVWREIILQEFGKKNQKKLQLIGETRWWSKQIALEHIFGKYKNPSDSMYPCLIVAFSKIINNQKFNPDVRVKAKNLLNSLLKYDTILTAHIFSKIFSITGPLSKYLQTDGIDLLKCQQLVNAALKQLETFRRGMEDIKNK